MYPESLPADWTVLLQTVGRPVAISPLHDKDPVEKTVIQKEIARINYYMYDNSCNIDSDAKQACLDEISKLEDVLNGKNVKYKKAHYHAIFVAKNPLTADAVRKKLQKILGTNAIGLVQIVASSVRNVYEYLTHESVDAIAKKKHVYPKSEITLLNGFDIDRYDVLDSAEKKEYLYAILDIIRENEIPNIIDLEYFIEKEKPEGITINVLREVIENKTGMLRAYFDGSYQRSKRKRLENESEVMSLNNELVESNFKYKTQLEELKNAVRLLKKELPSVVDYIQFDEEEE